MKKNTLRILSATLSVVFAALVLSGCGGIKNQGSSSDVQSSSVATSTQAQDKYAPIKDKVYNIKALVFTYANPTPESEVIKKYNETFNVKLEGVFIDPAKWDDLLNLKLASGEIPDVLIAKSVDRLSKYQGQGLLIDVPKDVINKYAPSLYKTIENDAPKAWSTTTVNGKNYGIPYIIGSNIYRTPIVWRGDWLKQVGITKTPDTIKEFEEAFIKFTKDDPNKNNKADTYGLGSNGFGSIFGAFGAAVSIDTEGQWYGLWTEKNGKLAYNMVIPEAKEALKLLAGWYKNGIIDPEFVSPKGENKGGYWAISTDFVNNRIGFTSRGFHYHWGKEDKELGISNGRNVVEFLAVNKDKTGEDIVYGLPPVGPDGKTRGIEGMSPVGGVSYAFSRNLANEPDKIGKILQMFDWPASSSENWIFNNYGVKDKHYEIKKTGNYENYGHIEPYNDPVKLGEAGFTSFFYEPDIKNIKKISPAAFEYYGKHGFDKDGIQNQLTAPLPSMTKYENELKKLLTEGYFKIIMGEKPVEYFDEMVSKWNKMGGEQLLKEANEWYSSSK